MSEQSNAGILEQVATPSSGLSVSGRGISKLSILSRPPTAQIAEIENGTPRRIGIKRKDRSGEALVVSPFGSRQIKPEELDTYDYKPWAALNLIQCCPQATAEPSSDWIYAAPGCAMLLVVPIFLIGQLIPVIRESVFFEVLVSILLLFVIVPPLVALVKSRLSHDRLTRVVNASSKALVILCLMLVGVGCPMVAAGYFAFSAQSSSLITSLRESLTAAVFGRTLQIVFIIIASTLPGLLYFIFERQKHESVRTSLYQQIVLLDPNNPTTFDARQQYEPLVDAVYGVKGAAYYLGTGGISLIICTILLTLGWITILFPIVPTQNMLLDNLPELFAPRPSVWTFGFLGAYFFALNMVFKRYVRSDLTAKAYTHISVRILITATLAWVLSVIQEVFLISATNPAPILSVTAFMVGIIPETGTTYLQELWRKATNKATNAIDQGIAESDPLTKLEGVNIYDRARLSEEGVDNVENLAHHNLIELVVRTRIPAPRLVDLVDQAILFLHAGDRGTEGKNQKSEREQTLQFLHKYGIRTATDLERVCEVIEDHSSTPANHSEGILLEVLNSTGTKEMYNRLRITREALRDAEWMPELRHWRKEANRSEANYVDDPMELFGRRAALTTDTGTHTSL